MKGFFELKGIIILLFAVVFFGSAMVDASITGVRCGLGTIGQGEYNCNEFGATVGSTFIFPDRNIQSGVESIILLREYKNNNPEVIDELSTVVDTDESNYRLKIMIGLGGLFMLIALLIWVFITLGPSSSIDAGSKAIAIFAGFLVFSVVYLAYTGIVEGEAQVPFSGVISLIQHPDVLSDVVDDTSILPGTTMVDDIVGDDGDLG